MAAHSRRHQGFAHGVLKKDTATKSTRRRSAVQAWRASALARKQGGQRPSLGRHCARRVPAPPGPACGRDPAAPLAQGRRGRGPQAPPTPAGRPGGRGCAPYAPAGRGRAIPSYGGGAGDMSDSEDSRIHDPAGVQDDGSDHPGDDTQGEESGDLEDIPAVASNPEELATQRIRADVAVKLRLNLMAQEQAQRSILRVQRLKEQRAELRAQRGVELRAQRASQWANKLLAARREVPLIARMEGDNVRVKLTLEGHDLPQVPALVPALPPLMACERCLTFPYVKANERVPRKPQLPPFKYCYGFGMGSQGYFPSFCERCFFFHLRG